MLIRGSGLRSRKSRRQWGPAVFLFSGSEAAVPKISLRLWLVIAFVVALGIPALVSVLLGAYWLAVGMLAFVLSFFGVIWWFTRGEW